MKLSIVVPVYNEEKTVNEILRRIKMARLPKEVDREIIVVDDCSGDGSYQMIRKVKGIKLFKHTKNKGKGAAIRTGIKNAKGDIILIQDADLEYDPNDYSRLIKPILSSKAKIVYGTRFENYPLRVFGKRRTPLIAHYIGNKFLTFVTNLLYGSDLTDMETCYKVFKKEVLRSIKLKANRFDFEPEITAKVLKAGHKIHEIPIRVKPRGYDEGKKITWRDGFLAFWTLVKYRLIDNEDSNTQFLQRA